MPNRHLCSSTSDSSMSCLTSAVSSLPSLQHTLYLAGTHTGMSRLPMAGACGCCCKADLFSASATCWTLILPFGVSDLLSGCAEEDMCMGSPVAAQRPAIRRHSRTWEEAALDTATSPDPVVATRAGDFLRFQNSCCVRISDLCSIQILISLYTSSLPQLSL